MQCRLKVRHRDTNYWKCGRAVYRTCLENKQILTGHVGSNPTTSAKQNLNVGSIPTVYSTAAHRLMVGQGLIISGPPTLLV